MKKYIIYIALLLGLFASCRKEGVDPGAGQRPEERTEAKLKEYQSALTGSKNGWIAYLYPQGGGGFSFFMKFTDSNRVTMMADISNQSSSETFESSYRLKSVLAPSLIFDTYNYMHILADPTPEVNGGVAGWGLYSDFEFSFDTLSVNTDTITLHGTLLDSKMVMVKATAAQEAAYYAKDLNTLIYQVIDYTSANTNLFLQLGDETKLATSININTKVFSINWLKDGVVATSSSPFAFTLTGITLKDPVEYNGKKIYNLTWDNDNKEFYAMIGTTKYVVQSSPTPILPLHLLIGVSYTAIIVPFATEYPGWSADFVTRRAAASTSMQNGPYGLRMDQMACVFDVLNSKMTIALDIYQGSNRFEADFGYNYTKTTDGVYKFNAIKLGGNASLIEDDMTPLTKERINVDTFTLEYFVNPDTGEILGQFVSVEHPDFTFSGSLY